MENKFFEQMLVSLSSFEKVVNQGENINFNTKAVDGKIIGTGRADFTQDVIGYTLKNKNKTFVLYDVPGIEGNENCYEKLIQKAVNKAHLIFYVKGDTKKPEPGTAEKLKKYLKNYTSVYSIINLHCKPKIKRELGIDKTYQEEIQEKFNELSKSIQPQTETVLKEILGNNFKESIILNGLEAFSAYSFDEKEQCSTIFFDNEKKLEQIQEKFFNEYKETAYPIRQMKIDSGINKITDIITTHVENFHPFIIETNKKKLIARLDTAFDCISKLEKDTKKKCDEFISEYKDFLEKSERAKDRFCNYIAKSYIDNVIAPVITNQLNKFYKIIDRKKGKINKTDYEKFFSEGKKNEIHKAIQKKLQEDYQTKVEEFKSDINKALERFSIDLKNIFKFSDSTYLNFDFGIIENEILEIIKDVQKKVLKVGFFAMDGAGVGGLIGGAAAGGTGAFPGAIIGAVVGTVLGGISIVIDYLLSAQKRIEKANSRAKKHFDELTNKLCNEIKKIFIPEEYIKNICETTSEIYRKCDLEIQKYEKLKITLENLIKSIKHKTSKLKEKKYGSL